MTINSAVTSCVFIAGLQRGVGAAGSKMGPMFKSLADMVGDNPALMDGLK